MSTWEALGIYVGVLAAVFGFFGWIARQIGREPRVTRKAPRCKMWVPLSYLGTAGAYHSADDTLPHARCCLPAGHRPRSVHLVDPVEIRDLNLARVPF